MDRVYTAILYLNDGWQPTDGGHLRLHRPAANGDPAPVPAIASDATGQHCGDGSPDPPPAIVGTWSEDGIHDVEPRGGRLIIFDARRILHEVRPSYAPRWALSAWLADSHSGSDVFS